MILHNNAYREAKPHLEPLDDRSVRLLWQVMVEPVRVDEQGYTHVYGITSCIICGRPYAQHTSFVRVCNHARCWEAYHRKVPVLAFNTGSWFEADLCGYGRWLKSDNGYTCNNSKYYKIVPRPRYQPFRHPPNGLRIIM